VLAAVFALSGGAGLLHEVVWSRLLGHLFGVTTLAISTVLAVYMAGLALGSWAMGQRVARLEDTRRAYALLEIGIGLAALAVPFLLDLVAPLYGWLWRRYFLSFTLFTALQLVLAAAILLPPTIMMGATLPALADYLAARPGRASLAPQWLYTANLAGAVLGVGLAGFVLMPTLGIRRTILAGALVNIGAGLLVLALPRQSAPRPLPSDTARLPEQRAGRLLLAAAFVSGFASIASQVAWTRTLILIVGSTTYAFSTVLLVNLAALALGSAWVSRAARDGRAVGGRLAAMHLLMAISLLGAVYSVNRAPFWYVSLFRWWSPRGIVGLVTMNTAAVFSLLLLPVLFAGTILPLVIIGAVPPDAGRTGRVVGRVYAVNTVGAILGALLASLVCIPVLGSERTLLAICVVGGVMGLLFAWSRESPRWLALASVPVVLCVGLGAVTQPEWEKKPLIYGPYEPSRLAGGREALTRPKEQLLFFREGLTATIAVTQPGEAHSLIINGRVNASDMLGDMSIQVMLAQVPLLLAPRTDDVLVLGWGSGVTVGSVLRGAVKHVTALEIEPAVVEASHFFDHTNHQPLRDPRLTVYLGDGRHILRASDATYDVIISEPSHPWITGVANLFTADFFALGARRLRPDGLFVQWLQGYEISVDTYRTILATFQSVFPEVLAFKSPFADDWILVGSRQPLVLDLAALDRRWAGPGIQEESERVGVRRIELLLSLLQLGPEGVRAISQGVPLNTDDNMRIEFRAPLDMVAADSEWGEAIFASLGPYRRPVETLLTDPSALIGERERLEMLMTGVAAIGLPTEHYKQLLSALDGK
jgi:spermidine synthase